MDIVRREVLFSGQVQGVGFRFTTYRLAQSCDVRGFVQNLTDGRVLLDVEGAAAELDRFQQSIQDAMGRYLEDVEIRAMDSPGEYTDFEIRS